MNAIIQAIVYLSTYLAIFAMVYYLLGFLERSPPSSVKDRKLPFMSIIIPAYNEEHTIVPTVESALALDYPASKLEILVVDDGSHDHTLALARDLAKKHNQVKVFTKPNGGKSSAMNFGIAKAKSDFIISFDADSLVEKQALKNMLPFFDDPTIACVTPAMKVYQPKGILQRIQAVEYEWGIFLRKAFTKLNAVHVTPGPFSIYRKAFFTKYGGYNEHTVTEDMEIALRIQKHHFRIENCIDAVVYTHSPKRFGELLKQRRRWYFGAIKNYVNYHELFSKEYGEMGIFILPLSLFSIVTTIIVTFYFTGKVIVDYLHQAEMYSLIGFDFINNLTFKWYILYLSLYQTFTNGLIVFGLGFAIFTFFLLYLVRRRMGVRANPISTFISYFFFISFYSILYTIWWVVSIIYSIFQRKVAW